MVMLPSRTTLVTRRIEDLAGHPTEQSLESEASSAAGPLLVCFLVKFIPRRGRMS